MFLMHLLLYIQAVARRSGKALGADKALGYKHALKEKKVLEELAKFRKDIKEGKDIRHEKHERAIHGEDWENIKQGIHEQFVEKIVKPLENISGPSVMCVLSLHAHIHTKTPWLSSLASLVPQKHAQQRFLCVQPSNYACVYTHA
jgi:hypothetical protein